MFVFQTIIYFTKIQPENLYLKNTSNPNELNIFENVFMKQSKYII